MRFTGTCSQPADIEFTVTITATLSEWKALKEQLSRSAFPALSVHQQINDLVSQAERRFYATEPTE